MPRLELVDALPTFLDEMAQALRRRETLDKSRTAAEHGVQRLGLGFNIDSVVREYGVLQECIIEVARQKRVKVRDRERDVLINCVITGIAEAVAEYQRQRETEQRRQANEHYAFIAHELRNPLGSFLSALRLLQLKGQLSKDDRHVQILDRGLTRMHELIDSSLRMAKISSGFPLRRDRVTLRSMLEDAEIAAAANAEEKTVTVTVHLETDVELSVDSRLVRSALTNLVRNAVKFTHDGGHVEIRARLEGNRVQIEVEDQCGGLPPGAAEKAFAPFVQLGGDQSGFGLGLAIARQAADAHGARSAFRTCRGPAASSCSIYLRVLLEAIARRGSRRAATLHPTISRTDLEEVAVAIAKIDSTVSPQRVGHLAIRWSFWVVTERYGSSAKTSHHPGEPVTVDLKCDVARVDLRGLLEENLHAIREAQARKLVVRTVTFDSDLE